MLAAGAANGDHQLAVRDTRKAVRHWDWRLFAQQMAQIDEDARYADVAERAMAMDFYQAFPLDGKAFFYEKSIRD